MFDKEVLEYLEKLEQPHLGKGLEKLSGEQLRSFLAQLKKYDRSLLLRQREALFQKQPLCAPFEPLPFLPSEGTPEDASWGEKLLSEGKVGCLLLAGGQGSRLAMQGPKGTFPISVVSGKSLFQRFFERALAASRRAGCILPLAVLTSPLNHEQTFSFLESHDWFGFPKEKVSLFSQGLLPFLDELGNWFLEKPGVLAEGPDGNGNSLKLFLQKGIWSEWNKARVEYVNLVPIDNPLADPFDALFCGFHARHSSEISLKVVRREDAEEKVGVLASDKGRLKIVEYSEIPEQEKSARAKDGDLRWKLANTGLFCFSMDFFSRRVKRGHALPWHFARKQKIVSKNEERAEAFFWKCETFLFDWLECAQKTEVLLAVRKKTFAPLKEKEGRDDLQAVQKALLAFDREVYHQISGIAPPLERKFELAPAFYYPTRELLNHWRGRPLPEKEYIDTEL